MKIVENIMKIRCLLFLLAITLLIHKSSAQQQVVAWNNTIGGTGDEEVFNLMKDQDGNLIMIGYFTNSVDFDPTTINQIHISNGEMDAFIAKYDTSGLLIWSKSIGGTGFDAAFGLDVDSLNNIYIVGQFESIVDFDPGINVSLDSSGGSFDAYILKLDPNGNYVWSQSFGGTGLDVFNNLEVKGNMIRVVGGFSTMVNFSTNSTPFILNAYAGTDIMVLKYDLNGNFIDGKSWAGYGADYAQYIITEGDKMLVSGQFSDSLDFDFDSSTTPHYGVGFSDGFMLSLTNNYEYNTLMTLNGWDFDVIASTLIGDDNTTYVSGIFTEVAYFETNNSTDTLNVNAGFGCFVSKVDSNNNILWKWGWGGDGFDLIQKIVFVNDSTIGIIGTNTSANSHDAFLALIDTSGEFLSFYRTRNDVADGTGIVVIENDFYICGSFEGTVNFNLFDSLNPVNKTSVGGKDIFIEKLIPKTISTTHTLHTTINNIDISPNPAQDKIRIVSGGNSIKKCEIFNASMHLVHITSFKNNSSSEDIDLINLSSGLYYIKVELMNGSSLMKKIIKQ